MKKLLAIVLALTMALSAAACANNAAPEESRDSHSKGESILPKGEPTEEELAQLQAYAESLAILNQWVSGEIENIYYYNEETGEKERCNNYASEVLKYHYERIQSCEAVDKWAGTEWTSDPGVNWDRQAVLDSFTVLEDVALYEAVTILDHVGNVKEDFVANRCYYNDLAQLSEVKHIATPNAMRGHAPFEMQVFCPAQSFFGHYVLALAYDENDRMIGMQVKSNEGSVINDITAEYGNHITVATLTGVDRTGETKTAAYTYDNQYRVTQIRATSCDRVKCEWVYSYTYDEMGNVTTSELVYTEDNGTLVSSDVVTQVYSYNADGELESCQRTEDSYTNGKRLYETKDVYTYECDEEGRPVKATVVPGDLTEVETGKAAYWGKAEYAKAEHVMVYGDYYSYNGK